MCPTPPTARAISRASGSTGHGWSGLNHDALRTRLVDLDTGEEIDEPARPGELRLKGAAMFGGYWQAPELTAAAFDADGWFRTGDQFEIAGEGDLKRFYRFVGRSQGHHRARRGQYLARRDSTTCSPASGQP